MKTLLAFPDAIVCVPFSQQTVYTNAYPNSNVLAIPDDEDGNCAKKSNAILSRIDGDILLLDDDILGIENLLTGKLLTPDQQTQLIDNGFAISRELPTGLWGLNGMTDPMKLRDFQPFSLTKPVYRGVGIVRSEKATPMIKYDDTLDLAEDVDFWLMNLHRYRKIFRYNLFGWKYSDSKKGGVQQKSYDRLTLEYETMLRVQKRWGSDIIKIKKYTPKELKLAFRSPIPGV